MLLGLQAQPQNWSQFRACVSTHRLTSSAGQLEPSETLSAAVTIVWLIHDSGEEATVVSHLLDMSWLNIDFFSTNNLILFDK